MVQQAAQLARVDQPVQVRRRATPDQELRTRVKLAQARRVHLAQELELPDKLLDRRPRARERLVPLIQPRALQRLRLEPQPQLRELPHRLQSRQRRLQGPRPPAKRIRTQHLEQPLPVTARPHRELKLRAAILQPRRPEAPILRAQTARPPIHRHLARILRRNKRKVIALTKARLRRALLFGQLAHP